MKPPPSLIALEIALILARKAADEDLKDPGGEVTARFTMCPCCYGRPNGGGGTDGAPTGGDGPMPVERDDDGC